jgi:hypothetical protein
MLISAICDGTTIVAMFVYELTGLESDTTESASRKGAKAQ